jgi:predicted Rossmann-fold nucleotide-binding protein
MSELPYKHFDNMMRAMEKDGLISKGDRDLYKIVSDPRDIIKDLRQRRAVPNSGMAGEQTGNIVLQTGGA